MHSHHMTSIIKASIGELNSDFDYAIFIFPIYYTQDNYIKSYALLSLMQLEHPLIKLFVNRYFFSYVFFG